MSGGLDPSGFLRDPTIARIMHKAVTYHNLEVIATYAGPENR